jgi:16S rRNA C967 or C1407 C5-methylase (RsmB/RsmF family)
MPSTANLFVPGLSRQAHKLAEQLFNVEAEQQRFLNSLTQVRAYQTAILWIDETQRNHPEWHYTPLPPQPWQPHFVDVLNVNDHPGQHPLHEQGAFYCLDLSSVFAASVMLYLAQQGVTPSHLLDLCASPGGKSIFAAKTFQPPKLTANESVFKRVAMLKENLTRCHIQNTEVTQLNPQHYLFQYGPNHADIILVDAPCSGQSLLVKGIKNPGCFHPELINLNAKRQRHILSQAVTLLKPEGYLIYMTCTFAEKENEGNTQWLLKKNQDLELVPIPMLNQHQSHLTSLPCYRLWPWQAEAAAGSFVAVFHKKQSIKLT